MSSTLIAAPAPSVARREASEHAASAARRLGLSGYIACFSGIVWREILRYLHQRERFLSALVRPLIWLFIFAAGFRQTLGVSIIPPYESYVLYEEFITPGLIAMILLFNAMQSSLSMVYDRETGAMRTLLVSPFPRSFLLLSKLLGGVSVALLQVYAFLFVAWFWEIQPPHVTEIKLFTMYDPPHWLNGPWDIFDGNSGPLISPVTDPIVTPLFGLPSFIQPFAGYITVIPALVIAGLMLGSLALFMSSVIKQLENFAGVMNFVIFPMFFASSALYPLWRIREASPLLYEICRFNPFTYAVELIRFGFHGQVDVISLLIVVGCTTVFLAAAVYAYNPSKGLIGRRGGPGGGA
ncbi:MAG: ABC transporter permease [Hyphomicrobium sp.]